MQNKILKFMRQYSMVSPGDRVVCAVSGGADSVALLWSLYLLRQRLQIILTAAHFNHHLRGAESDRDEQFVKDLCSRYDIPLTVGHGHVTAGKKGLEAAARDARYTFLSSMPGKIATAHTADDNAETVLLHLIRGTGLKGLGSIAPVNGNLIRPMLAVTRQEVESFLDQYHVAHIEDSTNSSDYFLRNRVRHRLMPFLREENPQISQNLSAMALRLREDETALSALAGRSATTDVSLLRQMSPSLRGRVLDDLLKKWGIPEPEADHIRLAENLVFSDKPSARASFPGGVCIGREYGRLVRVEEWGGIEAVALKIPGITEIPQLGLSVRCSEANEIVSGRTVFTVVPQGQVVVRSRIAGDRIRLSGGTVSLKKRFTDDKIPAFRRMRIPVVADEAGVIGVWGLGPDLDRTADCLPAVTISLEYQK